MIVSVVSEIIFHLIFEPGSQFSFKNVFSFLFNSYFFNLFSNFAFALDLFVFIILVFQNDWITQITMSFGCCSCISSCTAIIKRLFHFRNHLRFFQWWINRISDVLIFLSILRLIAKSSHFN